MRSNGGDDVAQFMMLLEKASPSDFDGHTDFDRLTPEQRLQWLSACAEFMMEVRKAKAEGS